MTTVTQVLRFDLGNPNFTNFLSVRVPKLLIVAKNLILFRLGSSSLTMEEEADPVEVEFRLLREKAK
jgi:hypothetical protein